MLEEKPITEFSDKELADMVRQSAYLSRTVMGEGQRFLLVLAVPYGTDDNVATEEEAFESFFKLVQDDDYAERNIIVYDHEDGTTYETTLETIQASPDEDDEASGDDLCDICMSSGVHADRTTKDGRTIGVECGCDATFEEDDDQDKDTTINANS